MSASLRACWSEMYVVIRVVHESGTDVAIVPRMPAATPVPIRSNLREMRSGARAERPAARRRGQLVGAAVLDRRAEPDRVALARAQLRARPDRQVAPALEPDLRLDLVAAGTDQDRGSRGHVPHPLGEAHLHGRAS